MLLLPIMKTCTRCLATKPESEYFTKDKKTGRLHTQCKSCYKEHRKTYREEHYRKYHDEYLVRAKLYREKIRKEYRDGMTEYLRDKSCEVCGESDTVVLEFDHIDRTTKSFGVSQAVRLGRRWNLVLEEIKKCRIVCANCHKRITAKQFGWYKQ